MKNLLLSTLLGIGLSLFSLSVANDFDLESNPNSSSQQLYEEISLSDATQTSEEFSENEMKSYRSNNPYPQCCGQAIGMCLAGSYHYKKAPEESTGPQYAWTFCLTSSTALGSAWGILGLARGILDLAAGSPLSPWALGFGISGGLCLTPITCIGIGHGCYKCAATYDRAEVTDRADYAKTCAPEDPCSFTGWKNLCSEEVTGFDDFIGSIISPICGDAYPPESYESPVELG